MHKVKITGAVTASSAAQWLNRQNYPYNVELESGSMMSISPIYTFRFCDEATASYFALRWV